MAVDLEIAGDMDDSIIITRVPTMSRMCRNDHPGSRATLSMCRLVSLPEAGYTKARAPISVRVLQGGDWDPTLMDIGWRWNINITLRHEKLSPKVRVKTTY